MVGSEDEDDYMNMTFDNTPTSSLPETSLQRRQRLKREGEIKARQKSKEELASEEAEAREQALSTSLLENAKKSKGLSMMKKMGFKGGALGSKENADAKAEPIKPNLKEDRGGIGLDSEKKRKLDEHVENECIPKKVKVDPDGFRDRVRRERELVRWERQAHAAQKVAERMDEEREMERLFADGEDENEINRKKRALSAKPLKSINVFWRGLVKHREEVERDRRMRYDMEQSLSRLPTYEDDNEDEDDLKAMGKEKTEFVQVEDLEEEDPELDEFNALEPDEKLRRLVEHLRKEYRYCFWCKYTYPDDEMEGCPGLTEDGHD